MKWKTVQRAPAISVIALNAATAAFAGTRNAIKLGQSAPLSRSSVYRIGCGSQRPSGGLRRAQC